MTDEEPSLEELIDEDIEGDDREDLEFSPFDELHEEFQPGPIPKVMGPDGLPMQVSDQSGESDIPALNPDTFLCMGDYSFFLFEKDSKEEKVLPSQVDRDVGGWFLKGFPNVRVRPHREPCEHYARQMIQSDLNPELKMVSRICLARSQQGSIMSVRDRAVYACDMRKPQALVSFRVLDEFDARKIQEGKNRQHYSLFKGVDPKK